MTLLSCCVGKREAVVGMSAHPAATCEPSRDGWDCEIFNFCLRASGRGRYRSYCTCTCTSVQFSPVEIRGKKEKRGKKDRELLYDSFQEKGCGRGSPPTQLLEVFFFFSELDCVIVSTRTVLDILLWRIRCIVNSRV